MAGKQKGNPKLGELGKEHQFKKDDPRINRLGRPKGIFKQLKEVLKKEEDYKIKGELTLTDYKNLCRWVMELNEDELGTLAQDKKTPIFIKMLCYAMAKDIKTGKLDVFNNIYAKFIHNSPGQNNNKIVFMAGFDMESMMNGDKKETPEEEETEEGE